MPGLSDVCFCHRARVWLQNHRQRGGLDALVEQYDGCRVAAVAHAGAAGGLGHANHHHFVCCRHVGSVSHHAHRVHEVPPRYVRYRSDAAAVRHAHSRPQYVQTGNRHFDDRVEFASLAKFYLGRWPYVATQVVLNLALLSLNLVSILETVQVMDWYVVHISVVGLGSLFLFSMCQARAFLTFGHAENRTIVGIFNCTYGLTLTPTAAFQRVCPPAISGGTCDSPFGDSMVIGLGYFVVVVLIIPMGYFNLDDNIVIQVVSTFIQLAILSQWVVTFFMRGFGHFQISAFGTGQGQGIEAEYVCATMAEHVTGAVLGNIILNYAFIMTVRHVNTQAFSASPTLCLSLSHTLSLSVSISHV